MRRIDFATTATANVMLKTKCIYETAAADDGYRVLVDRLWPRGLTKEKAAIDLWAKAISPSDELRRWVKQGSERFEEFAVRYALELTTPEKKLLLDDLRNRARKGAVTLLFAHRNEAQNNATVLADVLMRKSKR